MTNETTHTLVQCELCGVKVRSDRIQNHILRVHSAKTTSPATRDHSQSTYDSTDVYARKSKSEPAFIQTKLLFEVERNKFLSLGFGDIAYSESDIVCVSSFAYRRFQPNSAIGSIFIRAKGNFQDYWPPMKAGNSYLIDVSDLGFRFKQLLIICTGYFTQHRDEVDVSTYIQIGLQHALSTLQSLDNDYQSIDLTALGTQYGGVHRRHSFDIISQWATDLFSKCASISHVRLVAFDLDTFVDYYESLFRMKNLYDKQLTFATAVDYKKYDTFSTDITTAVTIIDTNPKRVIVICRTIIEDIVSKLCHRHLGRSSTKLFDDIKQLNTSKYLPNYIYSYLETCRVLGNFSAHDMDFQPTRRDAEGIMILTLRVVEWYLGFS